MCPNASKKSDPEIVFNHGVMKRRIVVTGSVLLKMIVLTFRRASSCHALEIDTGESDKTPGTRTPIP